MQTRNPWPALIATLAVGIAEAQVVVPRPGPATASQPRIAVDPSQGDRLYIATEDTSEPPRLYRSDDGGGSFQEITPPLPGLAAGPVLVLADGTVLAAVADGVARSTNQGASWQMTGGSCCLYDLEAAPGSPGVVYGAAFGALIRSADGGATWSVLPPPPGGQQAYVDIEVAPGASATVYLADAYAGLFRSVDGGQSWVALSTPGSEGPVTALALDPAQPGRLFAATYEEGVWRSLDGGQNWLRLDLGVPNPQVFAIAHDAAGVLHAGLWGFGPVVLRSSDGGQSWTDAAPAMRDLHVRQLAPHPSVPGRVFAGTER